MSLIIAKFSKKLKKDNKGSIIIEAIVGVMLMLGIFCFLFDLLFVIWKSSTVAQLATTVARQAGIQGGYLNKAPAGFPGGDNAYVSLGEVIKQIDNQLTSSGIPSDKWQLKINGRTYTSSTSGSASTGEIDQKEEIRVSLVVENNWKMTSSYIPAINPTNIISANRTTLSEWKYNFDDWENE